MTSTRPRSRQFNRMVTLVAVITAIAAGLVVLAALNPPTSQPDEISIEQITVTQSGWVDPQFVVADPVLRVGCLTTTSLARSSGGNSVEVYRSAGGALVVKTKLADLPPANVSAELFQQATAGGYPSVHFLF